MEGYKLEFPDREALDQLQQHAEFADHNLQARDAPASPWPSPSGGAFGPAQTSVKT